MSISFLITDDKRAGGGFQVCGVINVTGGVSLMGDERRSDRSER